MTVLEQRGAYRPTPPPAWQPRTDPAPLLPDALPYRVLGTEAAAQADPGLLRRLYAELVRGRRYNTQATALTKQGRLAVYPSSTGQEACEVAAALVLEDRDWLFPSYRDTLAAVARGLDPVQALTLLRGDWHTGYDPREHRIAPLCTPLATQLPHAVGLAHAARLKRRRRGRPGHGRRRRHQRGRLPRGAELRRRLAGPGRLPRAEQRLRHLRTARQADRRPDAGPQGRRLRDAGPPGGRQRRGGRARGAQRGRPPRARGRRSDAGRGGHVPHRGPHQRRRRHPLPRRRRGRGLARARPDRAAGARADRARAARRRRRAGRARGRRDDGRGSARAHEPGPGARPDGPVRPCLRRAHTATARAGGAAARRAGSRGTRPETGAERAR